MDLVVTSLEAWDTVWRRNQHLVAGLLRRDPGPRVLFVEPATDPLHAGLGGGRPRRGRGLRAHEGDGIPAGSLWLLEPTKWLPRRVDRSVDERWARQVVRSARGLGMGDPVLWVNDPRGAMLVGATTWRSLYDVTDDWTLADRPPAETARIQAQESVLLSRCDEVVVCSPALAASKGEGRDVTLIPNGVDAAAYAVAHERPAGLPDGPVVLYAGTLHGDRLDVALCARLAHALEGRGHLVLLGPDALEAAQRSVLEEAGVVLLGARPSGEVPAHLQHADVLVVPHAVTPFTDSLDPIKLYEYQAAGRPVVSTPVAGFRDSDDDLVTVADSGDFVAATLGTLDAVGAPGVGASALVAAGRLASIDWSRRVDQMATVLARLNARGSA
ncbi:glycosyltransferase involved in cell wall biosynthesis [Humibacillus xanthopallidus]|uniref:Glycosyltransferase involved in cell wall biosynthesis n=1 Tax=Humibacillus xanthopallidus TaxID=412689 RepID=A0A543PXI4_9MICO|nr:glycosyltransferase [Humibacillus xanthopallidus]TQN48760.1 glycosyltransferase involved in cell wall biosynthesis [Humibacillus xanthopallidus]